MTAEHTETTLLDYRSFPPGERPDCEVRRYDSGGHMCWYPGEVRGWYLYEDGWYANVSWRLKPGYTYLDTVPADDVRKAEVPGE